MKSSCPYPTPPASHHHWSLLIMSANTSSPVEHGDWKPHFSARTPAGEAVPSRAEKQHANGSHTVNPLPRPLCYVAVHVDFLLPVLLGFSRETDKRHK